MLALITHLLAATLHASASGACPEFPTDLATLVPDEASAVLGLDVDAFAATSTGKAVIPALRADLGLAQTLEILDDCKLSLERSYALLVARGTGDGRMAVLQGRAYGEASTLACLASELRARNDNVEPWTPVSGPCGQELSTLDGDRVWVINEYTLVWARGDFIDPVAERLSGAAAMAVPTTLARALDRVERDAHLWLAAELDADDRAALPGRWSSEARFVSATLDFGEGLDALFTLAAPDLAGTAALRELVLAGVLDLAQQLDDYGVEHQLRDRARLGIVDGVVATRIILDERELRSIRERIGEQVVGRGPL